MTRVTDVPIMDQDFESRGPLVVGDGAWLGAGVTVLDGMRIGIGSVVGAGSVVTRDIPDYAVAVGVPARVIGYREGYETDRGSWTEPAAGDVREH